MSESKHTPGPWRAGYFDDKALALEWLKQQSDVQVIATGLSSVSPGLCEYIAFVLGEDAPDQANATLIASAPDMAAELERLTRENERLERVVKQAIEATRMQKRPGIVASNETYRGKDVFENQFPDLYDELTRQQ